MTSSITRPDARPSAVAATVDEDSLIVVLADGRKLIVPLSWFGLAREC